MPNYFYKLRRQVCAYLAAGIIGIGLPLPTPGMQGGDLVVTGRQFLTFENSPYHVTGITVLPGAELVIGPGVTVYVHEHGRIASDGTLRIEGTEELPVRILPESGFWDQLVITERSPLFAATHVQLEGMRDGISDLAEKSVMAYVTLKDGLDTLLTIGSRNKKYGALEISNLVMRSELENTRAMQMRILGDYDVIRLYDVAFLSKQPLAAEAEVRIEGSYGTAELKGLLFPGNCQPHDRQLIKNVIWSIVGDPASCLVPKMPVVFVPGFGASINAHKLASLDLATPERDGWKFFTTLVPAYERFLAELDYEHIPYAVAYYDWRLPAARAADLYLKPVIDAVKKQFGTQTVNIVAHSFGGLVARAYLQGTAYANDAQNFVEMAVPNLGAAKAYPVWQGGQVPDDWSVARYLLRYYIYKANKELSTTEAIRTFVPSLRDLLPVYPAVFERGVARDPNAMLERNDFLLGLEKGRQALLDRVRLNVVASNSELTRERYSVGPVLGKSSAEWPDGKLLDSQPKEQRVGDGTVPFISSRLSGSQNEAVVAGLHDKIPEIAAESVINWLYPQLHYVRPVGIPPGKALLRQLSFLFDCPIEVAITAPDGSVYSSAKPDSPSVAVSDDLTWMVLPAQEGEYHVTITAKADTEVRGWVNDGPITTRLLSKGGQIVWSYEDGTALRGVQEPVTQTDGDTASWTPAASAMPARRTNIPALPAVGFAFDMPLQATDAPPDPKVSEKFPTEVASRVFAAPAVSGAGTGRFRLVAAIALLILLAGLLISRRRE